jgi:hypothetical protein
VFIPAFPIDSSGFVSCTYEEAGAEAGSPFAPVKREASVELWSPSPSPSPLSAAAPDVAADSWEFPLILGNSETPAIYVTVLVTVVYIVEASSSELAAALADGKPERTTVCVAIGVLPKIVVSRLTNVLTPVTSVRSVSTSSADGP